MGKLDIDKLKNVASNLSSFKSKLDKLDFDKLVSAPVDYSRPSDVVKNDLVKKDNAIIMYNANIKILDTTNLATNVSLNAKINELKSEITVLLI